MRDIKCGIARLLSFLDAKVVGLSVTNSKVLWQRNPKDAFPMMGRAQQ